MFNIKLVDIEGDGLITEFNTVVETLKEAELLAGAAISERIGVTCIQLRHEHDLVYDVISDGDIVGSIVIRSI